MARTKSSPKKNFSRPRRIKKALRAKAKKRGLRMMVRRQVNAMAETKEKRTAVANLALSGDPASATYVNGFFTPHTVIAGIPQGTKIDERVGNRVKLTRVTFNAILRANYDRTAPMLVMMLVLTDKHKPTEVLATDWNDAAFGNQTATAGNILQDGSTTTGFAKRLTDTMVPINTDRYTVYRRKVWKVGRAEANAANSNNDFKLLHRLKVNLLKYMPKTYRWNDANASNLNRRVFIAFHVVLADGGQLSLPNDSAAWLDYSWDIRWKDL